MTKRQFSRIKGKGSSKYLGVSWYAKNAKWRAQFRVEGEIIWCGWHTSELDAVRAINKKCDELGIERRNVYTGTTKSTESATEMDEAHGVDRKSDELQIGRKNQDTGHPSLKSHVHLDRDEDKTVNFQQKLYVLQNRKVSIIWGFLFLERGFSFFSRSL